MLHVKRGNKKWYVITSDGWAVAQFDTGYEAYAYINSVPTGHKYVLCVDTGEVFYGPRELSKLLNVTKNSLARDMKEHKPVQGKFYVRI